MKNIFMIAILASWMSLDACTGIRLKANDGSIVHGRTLEFGTDLEPGIAVVPRGSGAKYAAVGAILFGEPQIVDGINEMGLSVGTFYFPGYAQYSSSEKVLSPTEFPHWILTQYASVAEVKADLPNLAIGNVKLKSWGNQAPPFHYIVYDREGKCLVIEPIGGKLVATDNPFGIFTNSPTFDWHMTNQRNYINLKVFNAAPITVDGVTLTQLGQGSGMVGLPGDFTPPSRFVRAFAFCASALPSECAEDAVFQTFHILNQFDIPKGFARADTVHTDYTMVTCVRDPQALKYYFKTYDDQTIRSVDLNAFNLEDKKIRKMSMTGKQKVLDISLTLQ